MKSPEQSVLEFHEKYGHLITKSATANIAPVVKELRQKLIEEEYSELMNAIASDDLVEIADGAADLVYVVVGTCISYGIPFDRVFKEVHNSNMTKTAVRAVDGQKYGTKTPKGPYYIAPQVERILTVPHQLTKLEEEVK